MSDETRRNQSIWWALMRKIKHGIMGTETKAQCIARLRQTISVMETDMWKLRGENEKLLLETERLKEQIATLARINHTTLWHMDKWYARDRGDWDGKAIGF